MVISPSLYSLVSHPVIWQVIQRGYCTRHCAKHFINIVLFNSYKNSVKKVLISPFYWWGRKHLQGNLFPMKCLTIDFIILSLCELGLIFAYLNWFCILAVEFVDKEHMISRYVYGIQVLCWKLSALSRRFWVWGGLVWLGVALIFPLRVNHCFFCTTATSSMCFCDCIRLWVLGGQALLFTLLCTPSA